MSCATGPCATASNPARYKAAQHTGIAVAHVGLPSGQLRQPTHDRFHHAAGTVTATPEPHRVVALVISDVEEGPCARFVIAKMSVRSEALGVEDNLRRPSGYSDLATSALSQQLLETCAKPARLRRSCTSLLIQAPNLHCTSSATLLDFANVPARRLLLRRRR
jgi:hypothetical protein